MVRGIYTGKDLYMGFSFFFFLLLAIDWMGGWWEGRGGVVLFRGHSPRRFHEEVNRRAAIIGLFLPLHGACKQRVFFGLFPSFHGYMSENIIYIALSQAKEVEA